MVLFHGLLLLLLLTLSTSLVSSNPGDPIFIGSGDDAVQSVAEDGVFRLQDQPENDTSTASTPDTMDAGSTAVTTPGMDSTSDDTLVNKSTSSNTVVKETTQSAPATEISTATNETTQTPNIDDVSPPDTDLSETSTITATITAESTDAETTADPPTTNSSAAPRPITTPTREVQSSPTQETSLPTQETSLPTQETSSPTQETSSLTQKMSSPTSTIQDQTNARTTESSSAGKTKTTTTMKPDTNNGTQDTHSGNNDSAFGKIGLLVVVILAVVCLVLIILLVIACRRRKHGHMIPGVEEGGPPKLKLQEIRDTGVVKKLPTKAQPTMGSDEVQTFSLDYEKHVQEKIEEHKRKMKPSGEPLIPTGGVSTFMLGKKPSVKYTASNASSGPRSPLNQGEDAALLGNEDKPVVFNFTKTPGESLKARRASDLDSKGANSADKEPMDTISDV